MKKLTNVFWGAGFLVLLAVLFGAFLPEQFETLTTNIQKFLTSNFGWYYLIVVAIIIIFCLFLVLSPIGTIRLGKPGEEPGYSNKSWFAMLFSAGMGIGLVFWGAAEPLSHYAVQAPGGEVGTQAAMKDALRYSFFHWGISAWSIYAIVALALAYFKFRKNAPGLISATLYPLLGRHAKGPIGQLIDIIAVFATVIGVATTLGLGAQQINGGLTYLFGVPNNFTVQFTIIVIVTILFMLSAMSGLDKGIQLLSNVNIYVAGVLLILTLILGPTLFIMNNFTNSFGDYLQNIIQMSFQTAPDAPDARKWIDSWTIFYWAWWLSWSPFVGIFIARISRGRTIRQFLLGVIVLPALVSVFWFAVFGGSAIFVEQRTNSALSSLATEQVLFGVFNEFPAGMVLSIVAMLLIAVFFITSADSATFVLGMQTTGGSLNPPNSVKVTWGLLQAGIASVLLYAGGLTALQNASIIAAFPFSIVIILMIISLFISLTREQEKLGLFVRPKKSQRSQL
ncbi:BCCT family glycine betaine transporter BetL [Listeria marthii]|uniref:BCCT family glycine betaine transporter BetL n=1 Tax=Listeria marthii TaxID=529731 RepID=UPI0016251848|nr:BCCT family glycine betaine transporter BetL [Listeria marthii]MBC2127695.1 BCCT family transporter [Listeria marthii]